jgi:hypothetical protein
MHKTRNRLYLCYNICLYMFQYVSIKGRLCTEHRTEGVYRGWPLSVHACYRYARSHYILWFISTLVPFRSWAAVKQVLDRKGLMGWVCLSVCLYVTPLLQHLENHMSKGKKGSRPERQLAALAKQALRTSVYIWVPWSAIYIGNFRLYW